MNVFMTRYRGGTMTGRPPQDDDATKNLRPEDQRQEAKKGTKIGLLRRRDVMADFRRIIRKNS